MLYYEIITPFHSLPNHLVCCHWAALLTVRQIGNVVTVRPIEYVTVRWRVITILMGRLRPPTQQPASASEYVTGSTKQKYIHSKLNGE
jgi:hypothetical protein